VCILLIRVSDYRVIEDLLPAHFHVHYWGRNRQANATQLPVAQDSLIIRFEVEGMPLLAEEKPKPRQKTALEVGSQVAEGIEDIQGSPVMGNVPPIRQQVEALSL